MPEMKTSSQAQLTPNQATPNPAQTGSALHEILSLPGSVLPLLRRDFCLFMYHYFGH